MLLWSRCLKRGKYANYSLIMFRFIFFCVYFFFRPVPFILYCLWWLFMLSFYEISFESSEIYMNKNLKLKSFEIEHLVSRGKERKEKKTSRQKTIQDQTMEKPMWKASHVRVCACACVCAWLWMMQNWQQIAITASVCLANAMLLHCSEQQRLHCYDLINWLTICSKSNTIR